MQIPDPVKTLRDVGQAFALEKSDAPLGLRLKAWWEGCQVADLAPPEDGPAAGHEAAPEIPANDPPDVDTAADAPLPDAEEGVFWSDRRIAVAELLWGEGNVSPGGTTRTMEMIGAFGVGKEVNILNLVPGLGGAAREIARQFDAWVTGYEPDAALAAAAAARSEQAGLAKRAEITHTALADISPRGNTFDCAFAREGLYTADEREAIFMALQDALKPRCPVLFTDYFLTAGREDDAAIRRWIEAEPYDVNPWTIDDVKEILAQTNFELRVAEDVTQTFRDDIFSGWAGFVEAKEGTGIPDDLLHEVLAMAELWSTRVAALDSGALTVQRVIALKI